MGVGTICLCVAGHIPQPQVLNNHHIIPQSWGGPTVQSNLVWLCPTSHVNVHKLIDQYVKAGGVPPAGTFRLYNRYVRELAALAWAGRPNDHPPITSLHQPTA